MSDIGMLIKKLRMFKGLTQNELLEDRYSNAYLSRIENGDLEPSDDFLAFLKGKLEMFDTDIGLQDSKTDQEHRIAEIYKTFKMEGDLSYRALLYLEVHDSHSYSSVTYLQMYSTLIRYYILKNKLEDAKETLKKSQLFIPELDYVEATEIQNEWGYYLGSCGNLYYVSQYFLKANEYYEKALKLQLEPGNLYFNVSMTKERVAPKIEESLYYSKKACEIFTNLHLERKQHLTFIVMAMQYCELENFEKAKELLLKAKSYMASNKDTKMLAKIEYNLGDIQQRQNNYQQALEHYAEDIKYLKQLGTENEKFYIYRNSALIFMDLKDYAKVDQYIHKGLETVNESFRVYSYNEILSIQAKLLKLKGEDGQYQSQMEKVIENCKEHNLIQLEKRLSKELGIQYYHNPSANFTTYDGSTTYYISSSRTSKNWYQSLYVSSLGGSDTDEAVITQKAY